MSSNGLSKNVHGQLGILYLLPNTLGSNDANQVIPEPVLAKLRSLRYLVAENPKVARQLLKNAGLTTPLQDIRIARLDEHTPASALEDLLAPLKTEDGGLVSDAGCPAIADPGAPLIRMAHERGIRVVPLVGPSSIILALISSGLNGQRFAFHGYLPVDESILTEKLRSLENESRQYQQTQIFIETPYRNDRMLAMILRSLRATTYLCVASELTLQTETIATKDVRNWQKTPPPSLKNRPTVFLFLAA